MNTYTIFCSEEQTKLAYKLGAPITCLPMAIPQHVENMFTIIETNQTLLNPTAEQMCGWLREKNIDCFVGKQSYARFFASTTTHLGELISSKRCDTYEKAILAAIDAALNYLERLNDNRL